jgi:tRNA G18 (ribose-2'-O)-methylase SpoU
VTSDLRLTSLDDPRLAPYRLLGTPAVLAARGLFVAEGRRVVQRLVDETDFRLHSLLLTPAALRGLSDLLPRLPEGTPVLVVDRALMDETAGFNIHRGCLGLAHRPAPRTLDTLDLGACRRLLVLEGVTNPDNIGGLFRNAAAFGVDAVVLGPDCGDPLYRKAIRTSMAGSLLVPFVDAGPWPAALARLSAHGFRVVALTPDPAAPALADLPPSTAPIAVLVGAEGDGLSAAALASATQFARVPMTARIDSLNVATAAAIALHHFAFVPKADRLDP